MSIVRIVDAERCEVDDDSLISFQTTAHYLFLLVMRNLH